MSINEGETIEAEIAEDISPHNKALYEAGKALLIESVSVGREFCKFMTTTSLSAIPIYLALLKFVIPNDYGPKTLEEAFVFLPPVAFLVSSIIFIIGYFPQKGQISLDLPSEIEKERSKTIRRRQNYSIGGFLVFAFGVLYGAWQIVDTLSPAQGSG